MLEYVATILEAQVSHCSKPNTTLILYI